MYKIFISIILFILPLNTALAEVKLCFSDAVKLAFENNDKLQAKRRLLSTTERDIGIARSGLLPQIGLNELFVSTNDGGLVTLIKTSQRRFTEEDIANAPDSFNDPGTINSFVTLVTVSQTIYSRKTNFDIKIAKNEYSAQGYDYLRSEEKLLNDVTQAFIAVDTAKKIVEVAQLGICAVEEYLKIAQERFKNQGGFYSDVLRAQTALTEEKQNYISAVKNFNTAKKALGLLVGTQECVDIIDTVPMLPLKDVNYYNKASLFRNDIKAFELRVKKAENNIKLTGASLYPSIGVFAAYLGFDHRAPFAGEGSGYLAGGFLTWQLFDGKKTKYEKLKSMDKLAELRENLEFFRKNVSFRVFNALLAVEEAAKKLKLAECALKSSEIEKELVLKEWKNSSMPFAEPLSAQVNIDKARADIVINYNAYKAALINLSFESGVINKELGLED